MDESTYIEKRDRIIAEIDATFNGVSLHDGIGYYEAHALDDYANAKGIRTARARDRQSKHWQDLNVDSVQNLQTAFSFTDRAGFYFLFPAFMVLCLQQRNGEEIVSYLEGMRKEQDPRIDGFSEKQKRTIAHCLQFLSEVEDWMLPDDDDHHDAEIAFRKYWWQFLVSLMAWVIDAPM